MGMSYSSGNYWTNWLARRRSRRSLLRGAALAGAAVAGGAMLACKAPPATSNSTGATGSSLQNQPDVNKLIGRTGSPPAQGESPVMGGTYNTYQNGNPPVLDPDFSVSALAFGPISAVMSRPFAFKRTWAPADSYNHEIVPDLAMTAESPDAVTWTLKLRPGVKFHNVAPVNGHDVEAEDFKATFTRRTDPKSANRGSVAMIDPAQIETPDKQTVVFKLKFPYAPFQMQMANNQYGWILPREVLAGAYDPGKTIIGSGPFLWGGVTPDVSASLKKNPDYYVKGHPYVDEVKIAILTDAAARLAQFTAGHLDYLSVPTLDDYPTASQQNPKAETVRSWDPGDGHVYFQLRDPKSPFQDIRLRQAVSLAIDRQAYGKAMLQDKYVQGFYIPQSWGKWALRLDELPSDVQSLYHVDLKRAHDLMIAAGGDKLTIKFLHPDNNPRDPWFRTAGQTVESMLSQLPWSITWVAIDYTKDWTAGGKGVAYGNFPSDEVVWWGLSGRSNPDEWLYGYWDSQSTNAIAGLNDPKYDALVDKTRTIVNEDERVQAVLDAQKYLATNVYAAAGQPNGLVYTMNQPRVHNLTFGDTNGQVYADLWVTA
jgi:peptide/nickel transport system substrate-binding protein